MTASEVTFELGLPETQIHGSVTTFPALLRGLDASIESNSMGISGNTGRFCSDVVLF